MYKYINKTSLLLFEKINFSPNIELDTIFKVQKKQSLDLLPKKMEISELQKETYL